MAINKALLPLALAAAYNLLNEPKSAPAASEADARDGLDDQDDADLESWLETGAR